MLLTYLNPGVATELKILSFYQGWLRRINGFTKFGGDSAVQPSGSSDTILGVFPYADGVIVCVSDDIFYQ